MKLMLNLALVSIICIYFLNYVTLNLYVVFTGGGASIGNTEASLGYICLKLIILLVRLKLFLDVAVILSSFYMP